MRNVYLIAKRELLAIFSSAIAWVFLTVFLAGNGFIFWILLKVSSEPGQGSHSSVFQYFFGGTIFYWIFLMALVPLLTMRLFADEHRTGTIEALLTAPVSDWEVVLGKYIGVIAFYVSLWLPSVLYVGVMDAYGDVAWGPIASSYLGVFLGGAAWLALGVFTSTVTKNQIVAAVLCFVLILFVFAIGVVEYVVPSQDAQTVFKYLNIWSHMDDFTRGLVDTRAVVYDLTLVAAGLFLARTVLRLRVGR